MKKNYYESPLCECVVLAPESALLQGSNTGNTGEPGGIVFDDPLDFDGFGVMGIL